MRNLRKKIGNHGFTMIELMVVVVIVGVLSSVAVPLYGRYIQNARVTESTGRIGELITSAKAHAQENQDNSGNPIWPAGDTGIVDLSASENFTYAITAGGGTDASSNALTLLATGANALAGITVEVTVDDINSNGDSPVITGL